MQDRFVAAHVAVAAKVPSGPVLVAAANGHFRADRVTFACHAAELDLDPIAPCRCVVQQGNRMVEMRRDQIDASVAIPVQCQERAQVVASASTNRRWPSLAVRNLAGRPETVGIHLKRDAGISGVIEMPVEHCQILPSVVVEIGRLGPEPE